MKINLYTNDLKETLEQLQSYEIEITDALSTISNELAEMKTYHHGAGAEKVQGQLEEWIRVMQGLSFQNQEMIQEVVDFNEWVIEYDNKGNIGDTSI